MLSNFTTGSGTTKLRQKRKIDLLTKELLQFYSTPEVSLHKYITRVISETEKVKFFGTAWHKNSLASGADVDKSIKMLNYSPCTNIDIGIPRFIDWYMDNRQLLDSIHS